MCVSSFFNSALKEGFRKTKGVANVVTIRKTGIISNLLRT